MDQPTLARARDLHLPPHFSPRVAALLSKAAATTPVAPIPVPTGASSPAPPSDAGTTVAQAPPQAGGEVIPSNYVLTGGEWLHPSCIHEIPQNATLYPDGRVMVNDEVVETLPPCEYTQYPTSPGAQPIPPYSQRASQASPKPHIQTELSNAGGIRPLTESSPPGEWWGWTEDTYQQDNIGFDEIYVKVTVPPKPTSGTGILYYFPGLQDTNQTTCPGILQPELVYEPGSNSFILNSEVNDSLVGNVNSTGDPTVSPGDELWLGMYVYSTGEGYNYSIYAYDYTSGGSAYLGYSSPCVINFAWVTAMEVGNGGIFSCSNVPYNYVNFTNISLFEAYPSLYSDTAVSYSPTNQIQIGEPNQDPVCGFNIGTSYEGSTWGWVTTLWQ